MDRDVSQEIVPIVVTRFVVVIRGTSQQCRTRSLRDTLYTALL